MEFGALLVLLNLLSFLVCLIFFIRKIKVKPCYSLRKLRALSIAAITITAVFLFYTIGINYIFGLELTSAALLFAYYIVTFCLLDIFLLLWHKQVLAIYKPDLKAKRPYFWKQLYQAGTYFYIGIRSFYFLVLFLISFFIIPTGPHIMMAFLGQYTFDHLINLQRYEKVVGFPKYTTFVLDNQLYIESLQEEQMVSVSKVYCLGLFKRRELLLESDQVAFKESPVKNVVLLYEYNASSDIVLSIEEFNAYYKLRYYEYRNDTVERIIYK